MEEEDFEYEEDFGDTLEPQPLGLLRQASVSDYFDPARPPSSFTGESPRPSCDFQPLMPYSPRLSLDILETRNSPTWNAIGYHPPALPVVSRRSGPVEQPVLAIRPLVQHPCKLVRSRSVDNEPIGFSVREVSSGTPNTVSHKLLTIATCSTDSWTYRALAGEDITRVSRQELKTVIKDLQLYLSKARELEMSEEVAYLSNLIRMAGAEPTEQIDPGLAQVMRNGRLHSRVCTPLLRSSQIRPSGN
jgi:hypothetical protein